MSNRSGCLTMCACLRWQSIRSIARPGDRLRYTIELHSGIEVLDAVSAIDPLPDGVQFAGLHLQTDRHPLQPRV